MDKVPICVLKAKGKEMRLREKFWVFTYCLRVLVSCNHRASLCVNFYCYFSFYRKVTKNTGTKFKLKSCGGTEGGGIYPEGSEETVKGC